ncbi:prepilin peptidase CpaA [Desulfobaculum xiamenense]|uniref:Prepilin peptidase CpaA n=1 Tax=Desulfobaculum xiamenense TaxID=995050 RepID=A0A846QM08_9BACT|nr:A24 family peptidase [Desulfobaculum xiamenense]NJB67253.1 prepilin peptidase CpaA [Desulfobaculum xiamenense]
MNPTIQITLTGVLLVAAFTDLRNQRIPNALTFPAMIAALAYHGATQGLDGLLFSLGGLALGFGVMLVPYLFGVMGAGDVKLMAAAGAFLGAGATVSAFLATSIIGGIYAVGVLLANRKAFAQVMRSIWSAFMLYLATRRFEYAPPPESARLPKLCYGVAIALGTILSMILAADANGLAIWRT